MSARIGPLTLAEHNRVVIAERTHWPAGVLETCERLDVEHPGWFVDWMDESLIKGWEHPAGYLASRDDYCVAGGDELRRGRQDGVRRNPRVFAADPSELAVKIAAMEERIAAAKEYDESYSRWLRPRPWPTRASRD